MDSVGIVDIIDYAENIMGYTPVEAEDMILNEIIDFIFDFSAVIDISISKIQETKILKEFTDFCGITEDFQIVL